MSYDNTIRLFILTLTLGAWYLGWAGEEPTYERAPMPDCTEGHTWQVLETTLTQGELPWVRVQCTVCGYQDTFADDPTRP